MKIAIYTAVSGNRTTLLAPLVVHKGVDYIAFVDKINPQLQVWQQKLIVPFSLDEKYANRRNAKIYKILPHLILPEYKFTIWHDGGHYCKMHPLEIYETYMLNSTIAVFKHRWRECVYQEMDEVIKQKIDYPSLIEAQRIYYKANNYPEYNGLYELPVIIRKNCYEIKQLNQRWWEQICRFSSRDQISFPVVLTSLNITPTILPGNGNGIGENNIVPHWHP